MKKTYGFNHKAYIALTLFWTAMIAIACLCGCSTVKQDNDTVYIGSGRGEPVMWIDGLWWVGDTAECPGSPDDVTVTLWTQDNKLWMAKWEYYGVVQLENKQQTKEKQ